MPAGGTPYFAPAALFILFRDSIEAAVILTVILQFLQKTNQNHLRKQVFVGVAGGVVASIAVGIIITVSFKQAKTNIFEGKNEMQFEAAVNFIASFFVTLVAFAMLRMVQMQAKWEIKLQKATEEMKLAGIEASAPKSGKYVLGLLAFSALFREGVEAFIFLAGVAQAEPQALPIPGLIGILLGVIAGYFFFYTGKQAKLMVFFWASCFVLLLIGAGMFSRAFHELQEMGSFGQYWEIEEEEEEEEGGEAEEGSEMAVFDFAAYTTDFGVGDVEPKPSWANVPLADWRKCCSSSENEFFVLLREIFGYSDAPTRMEVVSYCAYWIMVMALLSYKQLKGTLYGKHLKKDDGEDEEGKAVEGAGVDEEDPKTAIKVAQMADGSAAPNGWRPVGEALEQSDIIHERESQGAEGPKKRAVPVTAGGAA